MENNKLCRMRSVRDTAKMFKEMDPGTEITECTLRVMIAEGSIPVVKTGKKYLINVDLLLRILNGENYDGHILGDPLND